MQPVAPDPILELKNFCRQSKHPVLASQQVLDLVESINQFEQRALIADRAIALKSLQNLLSVSLPARDFKLLYCLALSYEISGNFGLAAGKCRQLIDCDRNFIPAYDLLVRIEGKYREQPTKWDIVSNRLTAFRRNFLRVIVNGLRTIMLGIKTLVESFFINYFTDDVAIFCVLGIPIVTLSIMIMIFDNYIYSGVNGVFLFVLGILLVIGNLILMLSLTNLRTLLVDWPPAMRERHLDDWRNRLRATMRGWVWGILGLIVLMIPSYLLFWHLITPHPPLEWGERAVFLDPEKKIRDADYDDVPALVKLRGQLAFNREFLEYKFKRETEIGARKKALEQELEKVNKKFDHQKSQVDHELGQLAARLKQKYNIQE